MEDNQSKKNKKRTPLERVILIGVVLLVILIGFVTIDQAMSAYYKAELLLDPCSLCESINNNINKGIINWSNITIVP
jgi:hypothetical protein